MCGVRDVYEYQLYDENGNLEMQGLARDIADKLWTDQNNIYVAWKKQRKLLKKYTVQRIQAKEIGKKKDQDEFKEKYDEALEQLAYLDKTFTYRRNHLSKEQWDEFIDKQLEKKRLKKRVVEETPPI